MRRYKLYKSLNLIKLLFISFYILTFDFILILSTSKENDYNTILSIINKFIKRVIYIPRNLFNSQYNKSKAYSIN